MDDPCVLDVAGLLDVGRMTVMDHINAGRLDAYQRPRTPRPVCQTDPYFIPVASLLAFFDRARRGPSTTPLRAVPAQLLTLDEVARLDDRSLLMLRKHAISAEFDHYLIGRRRYLDPDQHARLRATYRTKSRAKTTGAYAAVAPPRALRSIRDQQLDSAQRSADSLAA